MGREDIKDGDACAKTAPGYFLVTGQIHGDERSTAFLLKALIRLNLLEDLYPKGLLVIPTVNPDGAARNQRKNIRGVDLNRNFPSRHFLKASRTLREIENPGPPEYVASEVRALMPLILSSRAYLDLHGFVQTIYLPRIRGALREGHDPSVVFADDDKNMNAARVVQAAMDELSGFTYDIRDGVADGDIGASDDYAALQGIPALSLEMPCSHRNLYKKPLPAALASAYASVIKIWFNGVGVNETLTKNKNRPLDGKERAH